MINGTRLVGLAGSLQHNWHLSGVFRSQDSRNTKTGTEIGEGYTSTTTTKESFDHRLSGENGLQKQHTISKIGNIGWQPNKGGIDGLITWRSYLLVQSFHFLLFLLSS